MSKNKNVKKQNYVCHCGEYFKTEKELISHYRKKHPNDADMLFDNIGKSGDKFSDKLIELLMMEKTMLNNNFINSDCELKETKLKLTELVNQYDRLVFNFNQLSSVVNISLESISNANKAIELNNNNNNLT
ncbi:MAG: hypothetical protein ACD_33C00014G0006 [uncultured bacterium]|nr:MAG: hypothetical protein ACD_33C00014G0006 [uncultured bacterium]